MLELIREEYGLEELEEGQPQELTIPAADVDHPVDDLVHIFGVAKVTLGGDVVAFKAGKGVGKIEGLKSVINDGNTLVYHFWDSHFQYVLLHEVKY